MTTNTVVPEAQCVSHHCSYCDKDLFPSEWKTGFVLALIISVPMLALTGMAFWLDNVRKAQLDPPSCYKEYPIAHDGTMRVFVQCP